MAKKSKFIALLASTCCLAVAAGVGLSVQPFSASAEAFGLEDVTSYQMSYGASVRMKAKDGKIGIRFAATLSNSDYADLEALEQTAGISVDYGMLIVPADMFSAEDLTVAKIFGGNYCFEKNVDTCECGKTHLATVEYDKLIDYNAKDGVMDLRGSLVNVLEENIARPFVGLGYIRHTDNTGSEPVVNYVFANHAKGEDGTGEANIANNTRSMAYVAQAAIEDGEDDSQNTLYNSYVEDLIAGKAYRYTINHYLPDSNGAYSTPVVETCYGTLNQTVKAEHIVKSTLENKADYYEEYATYTIDSTVKGAKAESLVYVNGMTVLNNYYKKVDTTLFDGNTTADVDKIKHAFAHKINSGVATVTSGESFTDGSEVTETGVMKIVQDGENQEYGSGYLNMYLDGEKVQAANAANWDYLTVRMAMTTNASSNPTSLPLYSRNVLLGNVPTNTWVDFVIPKALFNKYDSYVLQRRHAKGYMETKEEFDMSFYNTYGVENPAGNYNNMFFYNNQIKATQEGTNVTYYIKNITWGVNCVAPEITSVNTTLFIDGDTGTYTPNATVKDDLSTNLTPAKYDLYEVNGASETLLTEADGSYTVSKDKQYKLVVTASDSPVSDWMGGNVTVKEYKLAVVSIASVLANGITFGSDSELALINETYNETGGLAPTKSYVQSYTDGNGVTKNGVLKYESKVSDTQAEGGYFYLGFTDEMIADVLSKYYEADGTTVNTNFKLVITMCVIADKTNADVYLTKKAYGGFFSSNPMQKNVWTTVELTADILMNVKSGYWNTKAHATDILKGTASGDFLFYLNGKNCPSNSKGSAITYYIDSITWTNVAAE